MRRHYFVGTRLDELQSFQQQLEAAGIATRQIHVLSHSDAELQRRHLHAVQSFMQRDVVHATLIGAGIGVAVAALALAGAHFAGWTRTAIGWAPFILFAIVLLGFCTWVGGFIGIQTPNHHFRRFEQALREGRHVFFVDLKPPQEVLLERALPTHSGVQRAGTGTAAPAWLIALQQRLAALRFP